MPRLTFLVALAIALPRPSAALQRPLDSAVAIVNVNLLPMDRERVLMGQTVVISRGVITHLGQVDKIRIPAGAYTIDGTGKYLIPGLVDLRPSRTIPKRTRMLLKLFVANGADHRAQPARHTADSRAPVGGGGRDGFSDRASTAWVRLSTSPS
jgi:hypothetical protein